MRLFPFIYQMTHLNLCFIFLTIPLVEMCLSPTNVTLSQIVIQLAWNGILLVALHQIVAVATLLAQEAFFTLTYHKYRYAFLGEKLAQVLNREKGSFKRLFSRSLWRVEWRLKRHLVELTTLSVEYLRLSDQFKRQAGVMYFGLATVLEVNLFMALSRSSRTVMRVISLNIALCIGSVFFAVLLFMGELNAKSKTLLPKLQVALHRGTPTQLGGTRRVTLSKLFLAETMELIAGDRISINILSIFSMTRFALLQLAFTLIANVLMILNLND